MLNSFATFETAPDATVGGRTSPPEVATYDLSLGLTNLPKKASQIPASAWFQMQMIP